MAYDPQRDRRRPHPTADGPAPVDALLGEAVEPDVTTEMAAVSPLQPVSDDPPPDPAVTPAPADPPSDRVLLNTALAGAAAGMLVLLALRHLWLRRRRRHATTD